MALFAETCLRCGKTRTRNLVEGLPTCDACIAKNQSEREPKRQCPVDGTEMRKIIRYNIVLDECPTCRGHWFDGDELALLRRATKKEDSEFTSGFIWGAIIS